MVCEDHCRFWRIIVMRMLYLYVHSGIRTAWPALVCPILAWQRDPPVSARVAEGVGVEVAARAAIRVFTPAGPVLRRYGCPAGVCRTTSAGRAS